ncbi:MAG: ABC transporter permease [Bacteroidota bacterium]
MLIIKIFFEAVNQAIQQLVANKLRSFLTLLGITIGIWCVISVLSAVDSLERNITSSINKLGDDIVYVDKFSWAEDPGANYWKWFRRPNPSYKDFKALTSKLNMASNASYGALLKVCPAEYKSTYVSNTPVFTMTYEFGKIFNWEFQEGRYFTPLEYAKGNNLIILGAVLAEELFGEKVNPLGKKVKFMGRKMTVIGVLEKEGESILQIMNFDDLIIVPFSTARKFAQVERLPQSFINVKAKDGIALADLEDEITGVMRAHRRLKPKEDNNFALNKLSVIANAFDALFGVIGTAGWVIGGFSILVGGFGVANIMFVSVKERTNIIGIKKALGAKQYVILTEFLIEAIILCIIGGLIGLGLVWLSTQAATAAVDGFEFVLSSENVILGLTVSTIIGIVAGFRPAQKAAKMDPVDAIRA